MLRVEVGVLGARQVKNSKGGVLGRRSSVRRLCEFAWVIQPRLGFLVFVSFLFFFFVVPSAGTWLAPLTLGLGTIHE